MYDQEIEHLKTCERHLIEHRVRPSILLPLWKAAGFAMGVGSAVLGERSAMACTEAVETVVGKHYNEQLRYIGDSEEHKSLSKEIAKMRDEELEHLNVAVENEAQQSPFYNAFSCFIQSACKIGIEISKKV